MGTSTPKPSKYSDLPGNPPRLEFDISTDLTSAASKTAKADQEDGAPPPKHRFTTARGTFGSFLRSGGHKRAALKRAIRYYVIRSNGGSKHATLQMRHSIQAIAAILSAIRDIELADTTSLLTYLDLESLEDLDLLSVLMAIVDIVTESGGTIDESIARDAWLDTAAELADSDVWTCNVKTLHSGLSIEHIKELLILFVSNSIE